MVEENSNDDLDDSQVYDELSTVEEKCQEYVELNRNGNAPSVEQFAAEHPELQSQILDLLPTIMMMEEARNRNLSRRKDGRVIRGPEQIKHLGDYRVTRELGRGGMGIVYEAHQLSLNRLVAIKLLPKHMLSDEQVVSFHLEASTAAMLHHTNIAPIYGVGESSGFHFYAMQLLEGISLDRCVASHDSPATNREELTIAKVLGVGKQIASALQYAHDQRVLHRDIKPSNLILDDNGNVWMTDFGLATSKDNANAEDAPSGSGTLRYMAPEKLEGVTDDVTGDIYSLGITLIELLSGQPAFNSERFAEMTDDIKSGNLAPLNWNGQPLPGDLKAVLRKSIAVNPANRYQSASDFEFDLANVLETRPVTARRATMVGSSWRWIKRNKLLTAASVITFEMLIATSVISTMAYIQVQDALDKETHEKVRAETASRVASSAMDEMFRQFSRGSSLFDGRLEANESQPVLTNESAELAKDLSGFYSQLASQSIEDSDLPMKALAARSRVGELNERLGRYSEAAAAYGSAINGYERLLAKQRIPNSTENAIQIAQLSNQLGLVKNTSGDIESAAIEHQKSIDLLTARIKYSIRQDERLELELARSFYFKARRTRPGMGPNSYPPVAFSNLVSIDPSLALVSTGQELDQSRLESLENAIRILEDLTVLEDTGAEVSEEATSRKEIADAGTYLLALCYRELATDNWSERTEADREYQKQAIELLDGLSDAYPANPIFRFEKMKSLAEINVFEPGKLDLESVNEAFEAIQLAIEIGKELVQEQPDIAAYRVESIHCYFKLGRIAELKSRFVKTGSESEEMVSLLTKQETMYRDAIKEQRKLAFKYPGSPAYRVWAVRFLLSLAASDSMQSRLDERNRLITRATGVLNRLPENILEKPEVAAIIKEAQWMNKMSLAGPEVDKAGN